MRNKCIFVDEGWGFMNYHELLKHYIEKSGLSLSEIEEKMREKGYSTNKAYISRLQNSKIPPAGDDINEALAEITGGDAEELILQANIIRSPVLGNLINTITDSTISIIKNNKDILYYIAKNDPGADENFMNFFDTLFNNDGMIELAISMTPLKIKLAMIFEVFQALANEKMGVIKDDGSFVINNKLLTKVEVSNEEDKIDENLTEDEVQFLKKQLALYRDLNLKASINE
jgi:transcriptional regulator with XRE-family HTH domain